MNFSAYRNITIQDGTTLMKIRSLSENPFTALSFQSLYTWKDALKLTIAEQENFCSVYSGHDKGYFCPMGEINISETWLKMMIQGKKPFRLMYLTQEQAQQLSSEYNAEIQINRNLSEYIYETEALAFQKKPSRNFKEKVRWFQKRYNYEVLSVTEETMPLLRQILPDLNKENDITVLQNMLAYYEKLNLKGILIRDNRNSAFIIGYENTPEIFTMSLVKSTPEWQSISVSVCEHEFAKLLCQEYPFVDLEEDLGISGLRNVKMLTKPVRMLDAWEAYFK